MNNFIVALMIGLIAGVIDTIPMILQKLNTRDTVSAFVHYVALGLIIPFVHVGFAPWITGLAVALFTSIPIMIIVYPKQKRAIFPMLISSVVLGAAIGIAGAKFIG